MKTHKCYPPSTCTCYLLGLEPADDCPIHSGPEYPLRCGECGKFMTMTDKEESCQTTSASSAS